MDFENELSVIKTTQERIQILEDLENIKNEIYQKDSNIIEIINSLVSLEFAQVLKDRIQNTNGLDLSEYLNLLSTAIRNMQTIELTIAFSPTQGSINKFYAWISQKISKNLILDIKIDSKILGGAIIVYKGAYLDYSLIKKYRA